MDILLVLIILGILLLGILFLNNNYETYRSSIPIDENAYLFSGVNGSANYTFYNPFIFYHDNFPKVYFDGTPPSFYYGEDINLPKFNPTKKSYNYGYNPYFYFKDCRKISVN